MYLWNSKKKIKKLNYKQHWLISLLGGSKKNGCQYLGGILTIVSKVSIRVFCNHPQTCRNAILSYLLRRERTLFSESINSKTFSTPPFDKKCLMQSRLPSLSWLNGNCILIPSPLNSVFTCSFSCSFDTIEARCFSKAMSILVWITYCVYCTELISIFWIMNICMIIDSYFFTWESTISLNENFKLKSQRKQLEYTNNTSFQTL